MNIKDSKAKFFTRGGQITFHNWRMLLQVNKTVGKIYFYSTIVMIGVATYFITPLDTLYGAYYYYLAKFLNFFEFRDIIFNVPYQGNIYKVPIINAVKNSYLASDADLFWLYLIISGVSAIILNIIISFFTVKWLIKRGKEQAQTKFVRGSALLDAKKLNKLIYKDKNASNIKIDDFVLPKDFEVQHILLSGTTGSGKSQLIRKLLDHIKARGDKAFIYDRGCSFVREFYQEDRDTILNAGDKRCRYWDLWQEGADSAVFENMANSLIPMHGESDPFWVNAARTIFVATVYKMKNDKDRSCEKLLKILLTSKLDEMANYLQNTEAETLVDSKIEKTAISIKSVLATYLKSLRFLKNFQNKNDKFSITNWINNDNDKSWIFITSNAKQHASLRPLLSMWLAIATNALLSLEENFNRRIWFIMDELPTLHRLPELSETIAEARKFGGCFVIGKQSESQMRKIYGIHAADEISNLLNTRFYFRNISHDMAKLASLELGEEEVEEAKESYSYGANNIRDGISLSSQTTRRPLIHYSQIMDLPVLECYLRLGGKHSYPITRLKIKLDLSRKKQAEHFIENKIEFDPELEKLVKIYTIHIPEVKSSEIVNENFNLIDEAISDTEINFSNEAEINSNTQNLKNKEKSFTDTISI